MDIVNRSQKKYARFRPDDDRVTIKQMMDIYETVFLDESFQRKGGLEYLSGWSQEESPQYITSHGDGETGNEVLLVDLEKAYQWAADETRGNDPKSAAYYKKVLKERIIKTQQVVGENGEKKKEEISNCTAKNSVVDGNNTMSTLYWYAKNLFAAPIFGHSEPRYFNELTEREQHYFLYTTKITIQKLTEISLDDTKRLFKKANSNTNLNNQEKRQCEPGDISDFIREIANAYRGLFYSKWSIDTAAYDKRDHEELMAAFALSHDVGPTQNVKKNDLDNFYEKQIWKHSGTPAAVRKVAEELERLLQTQDWSAKLKNGELAIYYRVVSMLHQASYQIADHAQLCQIILNHLTDHAVHYKSQKFSDDDRQYQDWNYWVSFWSTENSSARLDLYYWNFVENNVGSWEGDSIITKVITRKSKDNFSFDAKRTALIRQCGKDRFGNDMTVYDLYAGKLEADHIKSVNDGGTTTSDNIEVVSKTYNRSKGSASNEPYFDYQKEEHLELAFPDDEE